VEDVGTDPDGSTGLEAREQVVSPLRGVASAPAEPEIVVEADDDADGARDITADIAASGQPVIVVVDTRAKSEWAALEETVSRAAELAGAVVVEGLEPVDGVDAVERAAQQAGPEPVVVIVAGGDATTSSAVAGAAARGWIVVPVAGSGGLAAELEARGRGGTPSWRRFRAGSQSVGDADVDVILRHRVAPASVPGAEMVKLVVWELHDVPVVKLTWSRLASYDVTAGRLRRNSERLEASILLFGIVVTFIALLQNAFEINGIDGWWNEVFHWTLVVMPVVVSVMIAMSASMAIGKRWVLLRAASESIRRELFAWRTRTGTYREVPGKQVSPHSSVEQLVERVCAIESRLMKSEVGSSTLVDVGAAPPVALAGAHDEDDGVSRLAPDGYVRLRIEHQLGYYRSKVRRLARNLRTLQVVSILAGGAGTILAVTGNEVWIGLSTAVAAAVVAHIGRSQIDTTLAGYNYAIASLEELRSRWLAVPPDERTDEHFEALVQRTETALEREQSSWQRHMSDGLAIPHTE
jgi:hypothetical protein